MEKSLIYDNTFGSAEHFFNLVAADIIKQLNIGEPNDNWDIDWESEEGTRIFIDTDDFHKYIIRLWNIHDDDDYVYVDYTVFFDSPDGIIEVWENIT